MRIRIAVALALAGALGCQQDHLFNPVGKCLIQTGSKAVTLADITTADILFVVDDSASMTNKQTALAANFDQFINALNQSNVDRVGRGLDPFDFHIAVTTSSIYDAQPGAAGKTCLLSGGQTQCCSVGSCTPSATACTPGGDCASGGKCTIARSAIGTGSYPPVSFAYQCCTSAPADCQAAACFPGDACPDYFTSYAISGSSCASGIFTDGQPFSAGGLVGAHGNPVVLHFTKELYAPTPNTAAIDALSQQFRQNIQVGNCGSPQEQHLEAARLAMRDVLAGKYGTDLPHKGAKLIVVWVGDEDDCSSPGPGATSGDTSRSIVLVHPNDTGADECVADANVAAQNPNVPQRGFPVSEYASYFAGLVAPAGQDPSATQPYRAFSAAFIAGTAPCVGGNQAVVGYTPADKYLAPICSAGTPAYAVPSASCPAGAGGIWGAGVRFSALGSALSQAGYPVVEDTVCDSLPPASFGNVLSRIAELVTSPSNLQLPTPPAVGDVTVLRIDRPDGSVDRYCKGPGTTLDWNFVDCATGAPTAADGTTVSLCVALNHGGACDANPGETYVAQYLGRVPQDGCQTAADCQAALGGPASAWQCYAATQSSPGTCLCSGG